VEYTCDLVGKIRQETDPTGTYGFAYDNMGRLIGTTTQYAFLPSSTFSNSYSYDAASNRTTFTTPDGSTNTYSYDTLDRLTGLTNSAMGAFGFGYCFPGGEWTICKETQEFALVSLPSLICALPSSLSRVKSRHP
jgi:YD repeat-containing protein